MNNTWRVSCLLSLLLLFVGFAAVPGTATAGVLYSNPADFPGVYDSWESQNDGSNSPAVVMSSFQFAQTSSVTSVSWQGLYVSTDLSANPPAADSSSFTLSVFASSGGTPGAILGSETFNVGSGGVQETFLAFSTNFVFAGSDTPTTAAVYDYNLALSASAVLAGGTPYFLSIVANTTNPAGSPYWLWMSGGDNGPSYSNYTTGPVSTLSRTFSIDGSAVPEPSSIVTLTLGVAAIFGLRRRRNCVTTTRTM